jgi:Glycosyl transferase family 2
MRCPAPDELPPSPGRTGWPWTHAGPPLPPTMADGSPWPLISIVTPSFNQAGYIEETIRSVLLQGYPNLEYLILDGGSTDGAVDVIRKYAKHLTYWVSERDQGQSDAINRGLARCTGELMNWVNSDDLLLPGALRAVAEAAQNDPEAGVFVGAARRVDGDDKLIYERWNTVEEINNPLDWLRNYFTQPSTWFRRRVWREAGPLDVSLRYALDVDLWIRAARVCRFAWVPQLLSVDRAQPAAKTTAEKPQMFGELALVQARHGGIAIVQRDVTETHQLIDSLQGRGPTLSAAVNATFPRLGRWFVAVRSRLSRGRRAPAPPQE